jgi:hypothetical protein
MGNQHRTPPPCFTPTREEALALLLEPYLRAYAMDWPEIEGDTEFNEVCGTLELAQLIAKRIVQSGL